MLETTNNKTEKNWSSKKNRRKRGSNNKSNSNSTFSYSFFCVSHFSDGENYHSLFENVVLCRSPLPKRALNFKWRKSFLEKNCFKSILDENSSAIRKRIETFFFPISFCEFLLDRRKLKELKEVEERREKNLEKFIKIYSFEVFPWLYYPSSGVKIARSSKNNSWTLRNLSREESKRTFLK